MLRRFLFTLLLTVLGVNISPAQITEQTWQRVFDSPSAVHTVEFLNLPGPPRIGFIGCDESVYRTSDGGATWQKSAVTAPDFVATDFTFKDSLTGWFANFLYSTDHQLAMCYSTTDGGLTWNPIYGPTTYCSSILYRPENGLLLIASWYERAAPGSGKSCYSTDGGRTWKVFLDFEQLNGFAFLDSMNGLVTAHSIYARTTDGGYTWNYVTSTGDEAWQPAALSRTSTYYTVSELTRFLFSSRDSGRTFIRQRDSLGSTTGTARVGSCGTLYAQYGITAAYRSRGVIRSQDGGLNWVSLGGPVNDNDTRFYVRGGYIFAGSRDTNTKAYSVWRYIEDSTFYDGGSFDAPQVTDSVLRLVSSDCGTFDSSLGISYLNDCSTAELISAELEPTGRFAVSLKDSLPIRLSGTYRIPIIYSPVDHQGDTVLLTLTYRTHGQNQRSVIKIIGSVPGDHTIARFALLSKGSQSVSSLPGDTVALDLVLLNDIPDSLGLDSIAFDLSYDENIATPVGSSIGSLWSLLRSSSSFGRSDFAYRRAGAVDLPANSIVATLLFKSTLSIANRTAITVRDFRLNDGDSVYLACKATATDPGSVDYTVRDTCGSHTLRSYMSDGPIIDVASDQIRVRSSLEEPATLTISDLLGHEVVQLPIELSGTPRPIDIRSLRTGVYFARLRTRSGFVRTARFAVER